MKIAYIINRLLKAGPTSVLYNIVRNIDQTQHELFVFQLMDVSGQDRDISSEFKELGIEIICSQYTFYDLELRTKSIAKRIEGKMQSLGINVVHTHGYHPVLLASYMNSIPVVNTIHCICKEDFINLKGKLLGNYMCWRFIRAIKHISCNVVISTYMMDFYSNYISVGNLYLIHNGVLANSTAMNRGNIGKLKKQIGLTSDRFMILVSSAFSVRKNQARLILELCRSKRNDFVVIFIGKGEKQEECRKMAGDDPRFLFLGYVMNPDDYVMASDLLISASLSEGLPMAVLEALVVGVPTLLSDIPPHREIVISIFQSDTLLFDYHSNGDLLQKFESLDLDYFDKDAIQAEAVKRYSARVMADKYLRLYSEYMK